MSDLPRILLCSFDVVPGPTGSSRRMTEYVKGLSDRFQVVVLTAKTPDHSHIERYHGARLLRVPVGGGDLSSRIQAFDRAVRRQLESEEYVLAHVTDPFGGYAPCEQKGDYAFRVIYEAHGFPSQELRFTHPHTDGDRRFLAKVRRQELFCLMNADAVITGSEVTRQFIQGLGVPSEALRMLRSPVDLAPYSPEAMGKPDGSPMRLIYLGSQVAYQGLPTLLRAMQHASRQVDVRLAVVGPKHNDWQAHLEDLVAELKLAGKVEFQPPVSHDDLFKVMATGDVGVLPLDDLERNRAQGGALAKVSEYLAAGRPVIAADLPVTRELLPEGATLFYPPGDFQALGERLIQLSNNPKQRVEMGAQAREDAAKRVDASAIRGVLIDLYDQLLGARGSAPRTQEAAESSDTGVGTPTSRVKSDEDSKDARVPKTDPAIRLPTDAAEAATDPTSLVPLGPIGPPPVALRPAPADLPVVVGEQIAEAAQRIGVTEPDARGGGDPPVVLGSPLHEATPKAIAAPVALHDSSIEVTPRPAPALLSLHDSSVEVTPKPAPALFSLHDSSVEVTPKPAPALLPLHDSSIELTPRPAAALEPPLEASWFSASPSASSAVSAPMGPPAQPASPASEDAAAEPPVGLEAPEESSNRLAAVKAGAPKLDFVAPPRPSVFEAPLTSKRAPGPLLSGPLPDPIVAPLTSKPAAPATPGVSLGPAAAIPALAAAAPSADEPDEISSDEVQEAPIDAADLIEPEDAGGTLDEAAEAPGPRVDPWFAQLAHGYCPPEGAQFARHTPPTNFPGRDE